MNSIRQVVASRVDLSSLTDQELVVWDFLQEESITKGSRFLGWTVEDVEPVKRGTRFSVLWGDRFGQHVVRSKSGLLLIFSRKYHEHQIRASFILNHTKMACRAYATGEPQWGSRVDPPELLIPWQGLSHQLKRRGPEAILSFLRYHLEYFDSRAEKITGAYAAKQNIYDVHGDFDYYELLDAVAERTNGHPEDYEGADRFDIIDELFSHYTFDMWVDEYEQLKEEGVLE